MPEANFQPTPQLEANRQLAQRWYDEVWNQKSSAAIDAMFSPNGKSHGFPDPDSVLVGPAAFKQIHATFCGAFPDLHVALDDILCEGDRVAIRWTATMTHSGDHFGFPASNKKVSLTGSSFVIVKDGWITDGWNFMEMHALIESLRNPAVAKAVS